MAVIRGFNLKYIYVFCLQKHVSRTFKNIDALLSLFLWFIYLFSLCSLFFYILLQFGSVPCLITSNQRSITFWLELI